MLDLWDYLTDFNNVGSVVWCKVMAALTDYTK